MDNIKPQIKCVFPRRIGQDFVSNLPLAAYEGNLVLVSEAAQVAEAVSALSKETVLGFDTESRPSFKRGQNYPVSILQLAGTDCVWVFKLSNLNESLDEIYSILENPKIKKVGVAVKGDINGLGKLREIAAAGFEDISEKTRKIGIVNTGLRNLTSVFLGLRISKSAQMSNWASESLSEKQISYAATDAWISRELYLAVNRLYTSACYDIEPLLEPIHKKRGVLAKFWATLRSRIFAGT